VRLVQAGEGSPRDVVIVWHGNPRIDAQLRAAAPLACIGMLTMSPGTYGGAAPYPAQLAELVRLGGGFDVGRVILCGWSEGGLQTRRAILEGADPAALVIADGTYASLPPDVARQIAPWQRIAELAKSGSRAFVASHTMLDYVETLPSPYMSSRHGLERVTGFSLPSGGAKDAPIRNQVGSLVTYSFASADADGHGFQLLTMLPKMLEEAIALLDGGGAGPALAGIAATWGTMLAVAFVSWWNR
jgi:pimeloyl-ACP methyl ester carboxylesterase